MKNIKLILFALFLFYSCKSTDNKQDLSKNENYLRYEDEKISIYYPKSWDKVEDIPDRTVYLRISYHKNKMITNFDVTINEKINDNMTLNEYNDFFF